MAVSKGDGVKTVCHNYKLRRYYRDSGSVIYVSKHLSLSPSMPCILLILTHRKGLCQNQILTQPLFVNYAQLTV